MGRPRAQGARPDVRLPGDQQAGRAEHAGCAHGPGAARRAHRGRSGRLLSEGALRRLSVRPLVRLSRVHPDALRISCRPRIDSSAQSDRSAARPNALQRTARHAGAAPRNRHSSPPRATSLSCSTRYSIARENYKKERETVTGITRTSSSRKAGVGCSSLGRRMIPRSDVALSTCRRTQAVNSA